MNADAVARHYGSLTPEERFRLIEAAGARGDTAEQDRLANTGQRITLSMWDFAPFALAFDDLALFRFIELQETAARYLDAFHRLDDADLLDGIEEEPEGDTAEAEDESDAPGGESGDGADSGSEGDGREKRSGRERFLDIAHAGGFVLRMKADGWKRFCERLSIPPFAVWKLLPGFDRLERALALAEQVAFDREGMRTWLNRTRPAGAPEVTDGAMTTAESSADVLEALYRERAEWWGG
jgi:hypothetical protein